MALLPAPRCPGYRRARNRRVARCLYRPGGHPRPGPRPVHSGHPGRCRPPRPGGLATGAEHPLREHHCRTGAAQLPGDLAVEERLASLMRWNALAMVVRANKAYGELGGHIASYASAADLFEVGFNHFFHAREGLDAGQHRGDLVFFQPHSAPGVYARAFLEGLFDRAGFAALPPRNHRAQRRGPGPVQLSAPVGHA